MWEGRHSSATLSSCPSKFAKRNSVNNVGKRFKGIRKTFRPLSHYAGFENRSFSRKTHQVFSVHTTLEEFKNATITGHFGFAVEENGGREITWLSLRHRFRKLKAPFSKCFPSTRKRNSRVFKVVRVEERCPKAPFSWRIGVKGMPEGRNKAAFSWRITVKGGPDRRKETALSKVSDVVWTGHYKKWI